MIKDYIKKMIEDTPMSLVSGVVKSVDKNTDTMCLSPLNEAADYLGVKLAAIDRSSNGSSNIVKYPSVGSYAVIGLLNDDYTDTVLFFASDYESVVMTIAQSVKITLTGNGQVTIDANRIVLNGGNNGGIPNITPLVAKINKLETRLNQLSSSYKTHIHPVAGASTGPTVSIVPAPITPLTKNKDLEDPKIKH